MRRGLLRAAVAVAAIGFAQQAQAQSGFSPNMVQPLIRGAGSGVQPVGDPSKWVSASDYPDAAVADRASGDVGFRLEVDEAGLVSGCRVTKSSGSEALDKATCSVLRRRARFLPGRNAENEPVGGSWGGSISWAVPPAGPTT